jgi:hypothetical protein
MRRLPPALDFPSFRNLLIYHHVAYGERSRQTHLEKLLSVS